MKDFENSLKIFKEVPHDRIDDYLILWVQDDETRFGCSYGSKADRADQFLQRRLNLLVSGLAGVLHQIEECYLHDDPLKYGLLDEFVDKVKDRLRIRRENAGESMRLQAESLERRIFH